ncbi:C2h2 finger domain [Mycena kentingensis (nom. inval.)]|nr:C2h2 finger domain [Mycena kentingensis (nom. inval.)]
MPKISATSTKTNTVKPYSQPKKGGKAPPFPKHKHCCPHCDWSWVRPMDLRRHMLTHLSPEERKEFEHCCPVGSCAYKTLQPSNLKTHMNIHLGVKPYGCKMCGFAAADRSGVYRHSCTKQRKPRKARVDPPYVEVIDLSDASTTASTSSRSPSPIDLSQCNWDAALDSIMQEILQATPPSGALYGDCVPAHLFPGPSSKVFQPLSVLDFFSVDPQLLAAPASPSEPLLFDPAVSLLALDQPWCPTPAPSPQFNGEWSDL